MNTPSIILVDSMIVIEAVRTGAWKAVTGRYRVVTVDTCANELRQGDATALGYVAVTPADLARATIEPLTAITAAEFRLRYPDADGLDDGERDLLALATTRRDDFQLCSCDKAAVRAAHALGWIDRLISFEALLQCVGARAHPGLRIQFTERRLGEWRTKLQLGVGI